MEIIVNEEAKQQELKLEESKRSETKNYDFQKIAGSQEFKNLMTRKKKFLIPLTALFLCLYFLLPVMTSYTTILNKPVIGPISLAWVYSIGLFIMTWVLCMVYVKKAAKFDQHAQQVLEKYQNQGDQNI